MTRATPAVPKDFLHQSGRGTGSPSASDQQIRLLIRFAGRLDERLLEQAFRALPDQDPVLGCRFVETGVLEGRWERRDDLASLRPYEVVETAEPEAAITAFLTDLEVPEDGPHFCARLVRSGGRDALCFRIDHRLADGGGAKAIAYLLAELYRTLRAGGMLPAPAAGFRPRAVAGLSGRPSPPRPPPLERRPLRFPFLLPRTGLRNERPAHAQRDIQPEELARLREAGKRRGATVTDLLLTALVRALQPFCRAPGEPFSLSVSCDFRSQLPPAARDPICNLFGTLFPALRCPPGEPFPATLDRVVGAMSGLRANLTLDRALVAELEFEDLLRGWAREQGWPIRFGGRDATFVILSNVGVFDHQRLDFGGPPVADARVLGTVALGQELLLCVSSFRGRLTLSHGFCRSDLDQAVVDRVMDGMVAELAAFAGDPADPHRDR